MAIKLIASDMDGTLLNDEKTFDVAQMDRLLTQMQAQDIHFVAASGNQETKLAAYFEKVGVDRLTFISDNGAIVSENNQIIAEKTLSHTQVDRVIDWNAENYPVEENLVMLSGAKGAYVSNHATDEIMKMAHFFFPNLYQVEKLKDIDDDIFRISLIWEQHVDVRPEATALKAEFGDEMHTAVSGYGTVDVVAPGVNKRSGLEALAQRWSISPDEMVAFGDNDNDIEMLNYVKHPFVMPNASATMQAKFKTQAVADNNHDGVLATIQQILNGQLD